MIIDEKEIKLKITPRAIKIVEDNYPDFNIVEVYYNSQEKSGIPRLTDSIKIIYTGYIGAKNEEITFEEFLNKIENVHFLDINNAAVELLENLKN